MSVMAVCDGSITIGVDGPECVGTWLSVEYMPHFDVSQISPVAVAEAFGAGLILMGSPLLVVMLGRLVISQIRRGY